MYNKVIMIGNLTKDIELKYLPSGSANIHNEYQGYKENL